MTHHNSKLIGWISIGLLFICCFYSAGFSSDYLFADVPVSLRELQQRSFKIHVAKGSYVYYLKHIFSTKLKDALVQESGVTKFENLFSANLEIYRGIAVKDLVSRMAKHRLLVLGYHRSAVVSMHPSLSRVLSMTDKAIIQEEFMCGSVTIPEHVQATVAVAAIFWGPMSYQLVKVLRDLVQAGIVKRGQNIITNIKVLQENVSWTDLGTQLYTPSPLTINSPLGIVSRCEISFMVVLLVVFLLGFYKKVIKLVCFVGESIVFKFLK